MAGLLLIAVLYLVVAPAVTLAVAAIAHGIRVAWLRKTGASPAEHSVPETSKTIPQTHTAHAFHLKWFRPAAAFAGMFKRRSQSEIEIALSRGYVETTPALSMDMAQMRSPWLAPRLFTTLLAALLAVLLVLQFQSNLLAIPVVYFLGAATIPLAVLMAFYEYNSPDNVSLALLARFTALGGAIAVLFATLFYMLAAGIGIKSGAPVAGLVEESAKLLAVLLVASKLDKTRYPYALNGLLFGAAMGTGFAIIETSGYILQFSLTMVHVQGHCSLFPGFALPCVQTVPKFSIPDAIAVMSSRGLLAPFGHIIWTAYAAGYYWWQRRERPGRSPLFAFCLALIVPVILHTLWDNFDQSMLGYLINGAAGWIAVLEVMRLGYLQIWKMTH